MSPACWRGIRGFFLLLFVATFAFGAWTQPAGPRAWGVPWVNFLIGAILIALLIAAATPDYRSGYRHIKELPLERDNPEGAEPARRPSDDSSMAVGAAVGIFFWVFLIAAVTVLALRLIFVPLT